MLPEQNTAVARAQPLAEPATPAAQPSAQPPAEPANPVAQLSAFPAAELTTPGTQAAHAPQTCANCGGSVPTKFCGSCGQRVEHAFHSVWHFTQEATEDLTHADSRLWSTMFALLFKPGFLTREFLAGRRVRYLPPLRLYLVLSVLFFVSIAGHHHPRAIMIKEHNGTQGFAVVSPTDDPDLAAKPAETPEERAERLCKDTYDGPASRFLQAFIAKGCRKSVLDNGHTMYEALLHNLPRAMFIFLPALAVMMKLMYWRPRRYYVEHLLFFVHNHAFAFLLFGLYVLLSRIVPATLENWLALIVWLYFPYYLFVSMRRVYGQGRFLTFMKYTVLGFTYFIGGVITLALTVTYSVYAL
jgi:Protein of unknown function (DUF3667)